MFGFLRIIRGFFGVLAALMSLTVFSFIMELGGFSFVLSRWDKFVETGLFSTWVSYICIATISAVIFYVLHKLINSMHNKKHGVPHPILKKLWHF